MIKHLSFCLIVWIVAGCSSNSTRVDSNKSELHDTPVASLSRNDSTDLKVQNVQPKSLVPDTSIRMNVFQNSEVSGWGYDILVGEKLFIHQPNIPAVAGNNGFQTKENAEKAAALVIYKMKQSTGRPSVTARELDSIGAR
jgi:hypothetical protein